MRAHIMHLPFTFLNDQKNFFLYITLNITIVTTIPTTIQLIQCSQKVGFETSTTRIVISKFSAYVGNTYEMTSSRRVKCVFQNKITCLYDISLFERFKFYNHLLRKFKDKLKL